MKHLAVISEVKAGNKEPREQGPEDPAPKPLTCHLKTQTSRVFTNQMNQDFRAWDPAILEQEFHGDSHGH